MTTKAIDFLGLAMALTIGVAVGAAYFGALWRSVRDMTVSQYRWRSFLTSLLLRAPIAASALTAVGLHHPVRAAVAVLGFMIGRSGVIRFTRGPVTARVCEGVDRCS
jgi:F1F0 ATPase subunit 2